MSQCWSRSRSPAGFNVVFFKPRVPTSPSLVLLGVFHVFLYSPVFHTVTFPIHVQSYADSQFAIGSVVKPSLNI